MPSSHLTSSYRESSDVCRFTHWVIVAVAQKQTAKIRGLMLL